MDTDMTNTTHGPGPDAAADSHTGSGAGLHLLPIEVLLRVTYWLPTPDLCNVRLTCRALETMVYNSFAEEFFSRKQFMFSQFSLQAFVDISKSKMSRHLRRPQFGSNQIIRPDGAQGIRSGMHNWPGAVELYALQSEFLGSRLQRGFLAEAFRNLEALEDVVIRDFNSSRRTRDDKEWSSYGEPTIRNEYGDISDMRLHLGTDSLSAPFTNLMFNSILDALGDAGARPKGIEFMTRGRNWLRDSSFTLTPKLRPAVVDVLNGLEKLHIHVDLVQQLGWSTGSVSDIKTECKNIAHSLPWFLTHIPNLKDLRINETKMAHEGITAFFTWMAEPPSSVAFAPGWPSPIAFDKLENLSFGNMTILESLLLRVIQKFAPKLRSLELWKVHLRQICQQTGDGDGPIVWNHFLDRVSRFQMPNLRRIMFGCMEESKSLRNPGANDSTYEIRRHISTRDGGVKQEYTGTDWQQFLATEKDVVNRDRRNRYIPVEVEDQDEGSDPESEEGSSDSGSSDGDEDGDGGGNGDD